MPNNPAARLVAILEAGKKIDSNTHCRVAWHQLLGSTNHDALLMSRLGEVMGLPKLAVEALREHFPHQRSSWEHWEAQVNLAFFTQTLNGNWNSFIGNIDDHSINYLRFSADLLQRAIGGRDLAPKELSEFRTEFDAILKAVLQSETELPAALKTYLARSLRQIIQAIDEYTLTGAEPILAAIESTTGHAAYSSEYLTFLRTSDLGKRLSSALGVAANVITVAVGFQQLGFDVAPNLPPLLTSLADNFQVVSKALSLTAAK